MTGGWTEWQTTQIQYSPHFSKQGYNNIQFEIVVQEEMQLKDVSKPELRWPLCSEKQNHCAVFNRALWEQFSGIILNLDFVYWHFYLELWQPLCLVEQNHLCNLVECIMRHNSMKKFESVPAAKKMLFKTISYLEVWLPLCSAEQNHLHNFGKGYSN